MKSVIKAKYGQDACNVGDEGGFAPSIQSNYEGVELLMEAIRKAGFEKEVKIGMDVAASEFMLKDGESRCWWMFFFCASISLLVKFRWIVICMRK